MADDLLNYYERELSYLRESGAEFAERYPKIAGRLLLDAEKCEDPHVERLLEGFAFLSARIHRKLDDELPEMSDALLGLLYPHYLAPVPSMGIAQMVLDPEQGQLAAGYQVERGTTLFSQSVEGQSCRFRTCFPLSLWPVEVVAAQLESSARFGLVARAPAVLRLELRCLGSMTFAELPLDRLRFYLHGESRLAYVLYEHIFTAVSEIQLRSVVRGRTQSVSLNRDCVRPVGFEADEGMLPYPPHASIGYRLLQEYFALPEKFLFFDLLGWESLPSGARGDTIEVLMLLDRAPQLNQPLGADNFRLGCTPIVNLYEQTAEPIRLSQTQTEYRVIADVRRQLTTEVYSVQSVVSHSPETQRTTVYEPFYSVQHGSPNSGSAYWYATRRPSTRPHDEGTEVFLSLVDLDFRPVLPATESLTIHAICSDRDLPAKLPFGGATSDLELDSAAPIARIRCLTKPGATLRPPSRQGLQWRLISHLALNYLSITNGPEALREILRLYDFSNSIVTQQQISGITGLTSRRIVARPPSHAWNGFCRGLEVTLELDEDRFVGAGAFLFASVLERFLGLYASLNSFVQVVARTKQREEPLYRWSPRAGERVLL